MPILFNPNAPYNSNLNATSLSVSLPVQAGSIYVIASSLLLSGGQPLMPTITDSSNNVYKSVSSFIAGGANGLGIYLFVADGAPASSSDTITATVILPSSLQIGVINATGTHNPSIDSNSCTSSPLGWTGNTPLNNVISTNFNNETVVSVAIWQGSSIWLKSFTSTAQNISSLFNSYQMAAYAGNVSSPGTQSETATVSFTSYYFISFAALLQFTLLGGTVVSPGGSTTPSGTYQVIPPGTPTPGSVQPGSSNVQQIPPGSIPAGFAVPHTISSTPNTPNTATRSIGQVGLVNKMTSISCGISNAKFIMKKIAAGVSPANSSYAVPSPEPPTGFFAPSGSFAGLPTTGPDSVNVVLPLSGTYGNQYFMMSPAGAVRSLSALQISTFGRGASGKATPAAGTNATTGVGTGAATGSSASGNSLINEPLFNGVIHLVNLNYYNGSNNQVPTADLQTILAYMQAITSIQLLYSQQWGSCNMTVDSTIYNATMNISGTSFNDGTLAGAYGSPPTAGFIDNLAVTLGFQNGGPLAHCFVIICPTGIVNTDCNPVNGYLAYHSASAVNNIPYIFCPMTTSPLSSNDINDNYQIAVSHEIAEMCVDPAADLNNPEVCDSCGPNCQSVIRNFFDSSGNYLTSSAFFIAGSGPGFTYATMTNSISIPPYATTASNTCPNLPYAACAYSPPGASNPNNPNQIPVVPGSPGIGNFPLIPSIPGLPSIPSQLLIFPFPQLPNAPTGQTFFPGLPTFPTLPAPPVMPAAAVNPAAPVMLFPQGTNVGVITNAVVATAQPPIMKLPLQGF